MDLNLSWTAPTPTPSCGYKAQYRRKKDPSYTEVSTSGNTATILVVAPASYEGRILSNCCETESSGTPFGVNAYSALHAEASYDSGTQERIITLTSDYSVGYDLLVEGTVDIDAVPTPFSMTYPAGSTELITVISAGSSVTFTNLELTALPPVFDNGGEIQQYDAVNTPPYFKMYWDGDISGTTWDGSPMSLPSTTLDMFTPTEYDVDAVTVLAGKLDISYIVDALYPNGFTSVLLEVYDPASITGDPMGSIIVTQGPLGLRSTSIVITKDVSDLTTANPFSIKATWPDLSVIGSKTFYLPTF